MKGKDKAKEQLLNELVELRQRIAELEVSGTCTGGGDATGKQEIER